MTSLPAAVSSALAEQISSYLSRGLSQEATAMACGCSPSYISSLLADPAFAKPIQDALTARSSVILENDDLIDSLKNKLLHRLESSVKTMHKTNDILRSISVLGSLKKETTRPPVDTPFVQNNTQVNTYVINLPAHLVTSAEKRNAIQYDSNNLAVEVDGQTLVPMQSSSLLAFTKEHDNDSNGSRQIKSPTPPAGSDPGAARKRGKSEPTLEDL